VARLANRKRYPPGPSNTRQLTLLDRQYGPVRSLMLRFFINFSFSHFLATISGGNMGS
jgi:hypothetical protein